MKRATIFATAEAVEEAFYDAMQRGDLSAMMAVWADDEDVVCVHPGGVRLVGLRAVRESFEAIFSSGGMDIRPAEARVQAGAAMEVRMLVEKIVVAENADTRVIECAATNVYVKSARGWRMVLHHAGPGLEAQRVPQAARGEVLH